MFNADVPEEDIVGAIQRLDEKFQAEEFSFQLYKAAGGYQFLTKPAYQTSIGIMLKQQSKKRLSTSAMETLSIIAYKQPISKTEIENIRGVNCDYAVQKLLDKSLIEITGKAETIGRPMLYGTTPKFMEYFGINDLSELPVPKEATGEVNSIGQNAESIEEMESGIGESGEQLLNEGDASIAAGEVQEITFGVDVAGQEEILTSSINGEEIADVESTSAEESGAAREDEPQDHYPESPEKDSDAQV